MMMMDRMAMIGWASLLLTDAIDHLQTNGLLVDFLEVVDCLREIKDLAVEEMGRRRALREGRQELSWPTTWCVLPLWVRHRDRGSELLDRLAGKLWTWRQSRLHRLHLLDWMDLKKISMKGEKKNFLKLMTDPMMKILEVMIGTIMVELMGTPCHRCCWRHFQESPRWDDAQCTIHGAMVERAANMMERSIVAP